MRRDRHTILGLVALGRITPYQAERLLIACNEGREWLWAIAFILLGLLVLAGEHSGWPALWHGVQAWFANGALHRTVASITGWNGGMQ